MLNICRIVKRKYYREFHEGTYEKYGYEKKAQFLREVEQFVASEIKFKLLEKVFSGSDKDLEKTIRFMNLYLLYKQSKKPIRLKVNRYL